ncbi:MAG: glucose 1-dehydrogenase [Synechococcales bacterium]|nr:glucose 1-dehydrogenase [Synechococcales bacterium]
MIPPLAGKTALITGAARGIGQATAIALAQAGAQVAITDIAPLDNTRAALEQQAVAAALSLPCDVTNEGQVEVMVERAIAHLQRVDILFNNAGVMVETPLLETSLEVFEQVMAVNVRGVFLVGRAVMRHMVEQGGGRVINTASELAYAGRENYSVYCASKAAILGLTRSWAREFAPQILVNAIAPGPIDTPLLGFDRLPPDLQARETSLPLRRVGQPAEVAAAVVFLAGPGASYITGHALAVNGGAVMG